MNTLQLMKFIKPVLLVLACVSISSCVSATIAASGKSYEHLLNKKTTVRDVRKSLGDASWSRAHQPPVAIKNSDEYRSYVLNQKNNSKPHVWNGDEFSEGAITSLCEVYTRKGPYADIDRGQGYAMASGLTLGIGDLIYMPSAIKDRNEMSKEYYSLTFWYDSNGQFIGLYEGDIRKPD